MRHMLNLIKSLPVPWRLRSFLRFLYRLPILYRQDISDLKCAEAALPGGAIWLGVDSFILVPDDAVANYVFRRMASERANYEELKNFKEIALKCNNFVDVGASGGFFSACFSALSGNFPCKILSIEMDKASLAILENVRLKNKQAGQEWHIDNRAVSSTQGIIKVASSGYGADIIDDQEYLKEILKTGSEIKRKTYEEYSVNIDTLENICLDYDFTPDFIKMDIEGFELELVEGSYDFLKKLKPVLALELHVKKLGDRNKDPGKVLNMLEEIGYVLYPDKKHISNILKKTDRIGCARSILIT